MEFTKRAEQRLDNEMVLPSEIEKMDQCVKISFAEVMKLADELGFTHEWDEGKVDRVLLAYSANLSPENAVRKPGFRIFGQPRMTADIMLTEDGTGLQVFWMLLGTPDKEIQAVASIDYSGQPVADGLVAELVKQHKLLAPILPLPDGLRLELMDDGFTYDLAPESLTETV